jgi:hypothetical protein
MPAMIQNHFPVNDNNPLAFVEYSMLTLSKVNTPYELNAALGDYLTREVLDFVERHRNMFFVTAEMWSDAVRRTIFNGEDIAFPDGLLMLPPLFGRLGWIVDGSAWRSISRRQELRFMNEPCLANLLALLFAEAMQGNFDKAVTQFQLRLPLLPENEIESAERYEEHLNNFGWPMLSAA